MAQQKVTRVAGNSMQTTVRRAPGAARSTPTRKPRTSGKRRLNPRAVAKAQRRAKRKKAGNPRQ